MRRPSRQINIFSLSALDLFASALGAFILIAVVLFPYYLKTDDLSADLAAAEEALAAAQAENAALKREAAAARKAARDAEKRAAAAARGGSRTRDELVRRINELERANALLRAQMENARTFALLGIATKAKSFVILVDMSESMRRYAGLSFETVRRIIEPMDEKIRVQIIGFQSPGFVPRLHRWNPPGVLAPLSPENKRRALAFVDGLSRRFAGRTPTLLALREALTYPAEAILLLSDGAPTDEAVDTIVESVTRANAGRMEIDTVALGAYNRNPILVQFLQALARRNRGQFTGVSG